MARMKLWVVCSSYKNYLVEITEQLQYVSSAQIIIHERYDINTTSMVVAIICSHGEKDSKLTCSHHNYVMDIYFVGFPVYFRKCNVIRQGHKFNVNRQGHHPNKHPKHLLVSFFQRRISLSISKLETVFRWEQLNCGNRWCEHCFSIIIQMKHYHELDWIKVNWIASNLLIIPPIYTDIAIYQWGHPLKLLFKI